MLLIDTNIFLEYLLNNEKAERCEKIIFNEIDKGTEIIITRFTLYSIEIIMTENQLVKELDDFLNSIKLLSNIKIIDTNLEEDINIIEIIHETGLDFDDALQYLIAKNYNADIVSYDKHFDTIKDLRVIKP